jgi:hypothetical protein
MGFTNDVPGDCPDASRGGRTVAEYEGYCVKCREKRKFDGEVKEMANGRKAAQGTCPTCGTKMNRMLGKDAK